MPTVFIRPDHLHVEGNVLSSTSESGLTTQAATADSNNSGTLRLRPAGEPTAAVDKDVQLQSGGNPTGYSTSEGGHGVSIIQKDTSAASDEWLGYVDTPFLCRVQSLVAYSSYPRAMSKPRTLSNGDLGFHNARYFYTVSADYTVTTNVISTNIGTSDSRARCWTVLESGRIVLLQRESSTSWAGQNHIASWISDDNGATWTRLSQSALVYDIGNGIESINLERSGDVLVAVVDYSSGGSPNPGVWTSYDGGASFAETGTLSSSTATNTRTCVTPTGRILCAMQGTVNVEVLEVIPGGGFGSAVQANVGCYNDVSAIACRDDGTIFVWGFNASGSNAGDVELSASTDDGVTFTRLGEDEVINLHDTPTANPFRHVTAGSWRERIVMFLTTEADTGSDYNVLMLTWGEYSSVDERIVSSTSGQPYTHTYLPSDTPDAHGWTKTDAGGGATVANQQHLNIVGTSTANSYYSAASAFWNPSAGDTRRIRARVRVNSGGNTGENRAYLRFAITDTTNQQLVIIRFATTGFAVVDGPGNSLGSASLTMTNWTDILIGYVHDADATPSGRVTIWTKQDADTVWTKQINDATVAEDAGTANIFRFGGGVSSGSVDWDVQFIAVADDDANMTELYTNPDDLYGRPLSTQPIWLDSGLLLGAFNGGGVPGDSYTVQTAYEYDKRNLWREFRPSRYTKASSDGADLRLVLDAGASGVWSVRYPVIFGTNARSIDFEMNASDSWGAPAVSQTMTTTIATGTTSTVNRGPGYIGPTTGGWKPGQFRSDGDAHRYFLAIGPDTYEITDNDADRLYVSGVDFSATPGSTFYVFSDRAGVDLGQTERYRYASILISAQDTADDDLRAGTPILALEWSPDLDYSHNHTDRVTPSITVEESAAGYRSSARTGPRRYALSIQWDPINRMHADYGKTGEEFEAFFAAVEGAHTPFAFWRDTTDIDTLRLVRLEGTLSRPNQRGELSTGLARIDQVLLSEEL